MQNDSLEPISQQPNSPGDLNHNLLYPQKDGMINHQKDDFQMTNKHFLLKKKPEKSTNQRQVGGIDSVFTHTFRKDVSTREGHLEREGAPRQSLTLLGDVGEES